MLCKKVLNYIGPLMLILIGTALAQTVQVDTQSDIESIQGVWKLTFPPENKISPEEESIKRELRNIPELVTIGNVTRHRNKENPERECVLILFTLGKWETDDSGKVPGLKAVVQEIIVKDGKWSFPLFQNHRMFILNPYEILISNDGQTTTLTVHRYKNGFELSARVNMLRKEIFWPYTKSE